MEVGNIMTSAFPSFLSKDVNSLLRKTIVPHAQEPQDIIDVMVSGETINLPYRVYSTPVPIWFLNSTQRTILGCWLTRHHDGYVRMYYLNRLLHDTPEWAIPYIFQLLGEYVIEILELIQQNLTPDLLVKFRKFIAENPAYAQTTKRRMISYWDCYYRDTSGRYQNYIGLQILDQIEKAELI